jgi:hypothetical protein
MVRVYMWQHFTGSYMDFYIHGENFVRFLEKKHVN